ncbi:amidohydrolase [Leifsonia kafniensis]|uniref:amidohydrolase n=1 Tax=Leifsonia kafniensis TaxID=475957 RepID=UPI0031E9599F
MSETGRQQLFVNGTVWLGSEHSDEASLLVVDGQIAAVGTEALELSEAAATAGSVEIVDLDGGFLMPSFGDGHAHPLLGGLEDCGPAVRACRSIDEIVAEVRRYAAAHPEAEWIVGASYDGSLAPNGLFDARWLDEAVPDRPVMLRAWDYHTVWVNSKALELAGIEAATPEPVLGEIPRRADGSPLGTLREWGAIDLVTAVCPAYSLDDRVDALGRATAHYARLGVTWVQDAWVEPADVDTYLEAAARGELSTRINLALLADPRHFPDSLPGMLEARRRVEELGHPLLTAHSVKFFADGVVENETGALLEPYCTGLHDHGMLVWTPEKLAEAVTAVDAAGFQAHIHAIGDAAVRCALDAIEHADRVNGPADRRAVIAHVQLATGDDLERFARLGVIATMQPLWAQLDDLMTKLTLPRLGQERSARQYAMRTLEGLGAPLAFGSDWPVSSAAPLEGIAVAVSRTTGEGEPAGGWIPSETLSIETALAAYSSGVATQAFAGRNDTAWGQIEVGASADLVWLENDPRTVAAASVPAIGIRATYLAGTPTYRAP